MKNGLVNLMVIILIIAGFSCQQSGSVKNVKLETTTDSVGYAIGVLVGTNNLSQVETAPGGEDINIDAMVSGFAASTKGEEVKITKEDANKLLSTYFKKAGDEKAQKSLEEGNAFLEQNKTREGVVTTESGLQYEILKEGNGAVPTASDKVRVNYHGTLIDGTVFDSTTDPEVGQGKPVTFGVSQVIKGWTEALQLMKVGAKYKIYVPASIGYGDRGSGTIPPNSVLIFEIELLEIVK